jgi:nicotinamide-nucleotide adenylyltransferase
MSISKRHFHNLAAMAQRYTSALESFISSPNTTFKLIDPAPNSPQHDTLHILDSSFNPPTNAHLKLAQWSRPSTLLLLLAIQNADKTAKPASFEHRLAMMNLLADKIKQDSQTSTTLIALSKHAKFVDKERDILISFPHMKRVVWLVGYDTLIRILDRKYYPGTLEESLVAFWERNRLVCAVRGEDVVERGYLDKIRRGEVDGVPASWAEYITFIEPVGKELSSTKAREAAGGTEWGILDNIVPQEIAEYIRQKQLYEE